MAKSSKNNRESETTNDSTKSKGKAQGQSSQKSKTSKRKMGTGRVDECCAFLMALETGKAGMLWRGPDGELHILEAPTTPGTEKIVACDHNGFYLKNP